MNSMISSESTPVSGSTDRDFVMLNFAFDFFLVANRMFLSVKDLNRQKSL